MSVWHIVGLPDIGPTLSSCDGIVKLKGEPEVSVKVISICAGNEEIFEQAMPYMPLLPTGLMSDEISA
jgi:hypothetical protein